MHQALLEIDKKVKSKATTAKLEAADANTNDDKRMQMYKNMRDDLLREESKSKSDNQK